MSFDRGIAVVGVIVGLAALWFAWDQNNNSQRQLAEQREATRAAQEAAEASKQAADAQREQVERLVRPAVEREQRAMRELAGIQGTFCAPAEQPVLYVRFHMSGDTPMKTERLDIGGWHGSTSDMRALRWDDEQQTLWYTADEEQHRQGVRAVSGGGAVVWCNDCRGRESVRVCSCERYSACGSSLPELSR